jgi:hypothetical protein
MELPERIIAYVQNHYPLSMSALEGIVLSKGFTLDDLYTALEKVHKDKRIVQSTRRGEVWYSPYIEPPTPPPQKHLEWIRTNYPPMTPDNDGSGIEADFSYLFLSPEELEKYKAEVRGVQYIPSKRYGSKRKQSTV